MEKLLKIYTYVDGVNDTPFPNADAQIEIFRFNYDAKRMGGAPTISASVMYKDCLDKLWTGKEYVIYNGERYKLKQTPTSSKNNTDARYKHDLELVALRVVLDYVYFFDAVVENTPVDDKPVTNSTKVVFSGDIHEFAKRLNASLKYTKLDYSVVVDDGITSETKFLSFDAQPISSVLQEIYKQYEIPYYFVGNVIHIGFTSNAITKTFKYGANDALLSISKNNANNKIVNRCTGVGSSENIPYYYPNEHPLGIVDTYYTPNGGDKTLRNDLVANENEFATKVKNGTTLEFVVKTFQNERPPVFLFKKDLYENFEDGKLDINSIDINKESEIALSTEQFWNVAPLVFDNRWVYYDTSIKDVEIPNSGFLAYTPVNLLTEPLWFRNERRKKGDNSIYFLVDRKGLKGATIEVVLDEPTDLVEYFVANSFYGTTNYDNLGHSIKVEDLEDDFVVVLFISKEDRKNSFSINANFFVKITDENGNIFEQRFWKNEKGKIVKIEDYGLTLNSEPNAGDKITFQTREGSLIPFQNALMPPIYWQTKGAESFYNAINDTYISPETGKYYSFENEYSDENRREHKETFDYIKPSIEFVRNGDTLPINMFLEFAYDENDNDEIDELTNEYIHPYFFAKLRKFNGENGFNLFDHANEKGEMTISMTSGNCGACNFVIGVSENTKKNIVQVDDSGNLIYESGRVKFGAPQDKQNDTINNEVWIALKKDTQTFGMLLPNKSIYPKPCTSADTNDGDTFVITNISLPTSFIREAEERLKEEIIKYMKLNNSEKFTFSIKFSRIYLAENPNILAQLNENARIQIEYNGTTYELYVSSYQYKVSNNEVLPEITVELADTLTQSENALQQAINAVEHSIMSSVGSIDFYKQGLRYFIRKDVEDWARGLLHLTKGATFGANDIAKVDEQGNADFVSQIIRQYISTPQFIDGFAGAGFKLWLDENGKSNLTIDNITARETFRVFEMLVTKLRAVNGGLFVSAANGTIKEVIESEEYYDIVLENDNTFVAGDYMRCQVMSGLKIMDYWVEIYSTNGITCRVLKSEFGVATPLAGQDVVLDGSKNKGRQNAIHISATEDGQPRIDIFNRIATKSHDNCLRARLGNLDGIYDELFGEHQPKGDGLYSDNAYLKGEFIVKSRNESVDTMFAVQEGKIKSLVGQTQTLAAQGGFLRNPSFAEGLKYWQTNNQATTVFSLGKPVFTNGEMLVNGITDNVRGKYDEEKFFVTLKNGFIKQLNDYFVNKPTFKDFEGEKIPVNVSFKIRVKKKGKLTVKVGDNIIIDETREATDNFIEVRGDGKWVGNEHFTLNFSGEADLTDLSLYTDELALKTETLIEQTVKYVNILAKNFDEEGNVKSESGLMVKPNEAGLYAQGEDGEQTKIAAYSDGKVLLKGDHIQLEGDVTANGKVHIDDETGTLKAESAEIDKSKLTDVEINGAIRTPFRDGLFALNSNSQISLPGIQNNNNVVIPGGTNASWNLDVNIPFSSEYNGFRAIVMNDEWGSGKALVPWSVDAPEGKYFFEDGISHKKLTVPHGSGVEMIGYGEGNDFKGWLILNRIHRSSHVGFNLKVVYAGRINDGILIDFKTYNGKGITVSKKDTGLYSVQFEETWSNANNYMVFVSGYGINTPIYASVMNQDTTGFNVYTGDDYSGNDGGFSFIVINTVQLYGFS